jgi:hypothetical protein
MCDEEKKIYQSPRDLDSNRDQLAEQDIPNAALSLTLYLKC